MGSGFDASRQASVLISVIVPSFQRPDSLARLLEGLSLQTFPMSDFEAVIVLDGPSPPVERMLDSVSYPFRLRRFLRPHQGETAARNFGVQQARADILVFLDDDTVPSSELLIRHYGCHQRDYRLVVVGALRAHHDSPERFLAEVVDWVEGHFRRCSSPGYLLSHKDLPDNNFSIRKENLSRVGGWDESLVGYGGIDDWEIGHRLLQIGLHLHFEPAALAYHYYCKPLAHILAHKRVAGRAQIYYFRKFPNRLCDLDFPRWATGQWWRRWTLRLGKALPDLAFTLSSNYLAGCLSGQGPRRGASLARLAVKILCALSFCRGFWDEPDDMERICRQLRLRIPILAYALGLQSMKYRPRGTGTLSVEEFARQMKWLSEWGYQTITMGDLLNWQERLEHLPPKPVILTFDEDFRGLGQHVVPVLNKYGFRATIFLRARQIEGSSQDSEDRARIREFTDSGYEIANGGLKESSWSALSRDTAKHELAKSKQILEEITGRPVQFFSYPSPNGTLPDVELLENCGYRGACSFEPGLNHFDQNRYLLKRTEVVRKVGRRLFRRILRGFSNGKSTVEKWRSYWSEMSTPTHLSDTTEFYRLYAQELDILFGERPMKRVLEIGCGNGALFPFLGFESCKYKGVDFSPTMLASFRARFPGIELECCEGSSYFDAGNKYDLIFSTGLIQYFDTLMLDHHFACVRSMMDHDSLFVCALIPWQAHRRSWYGGRFSGDGKMSWTLLAKHRIRTALKGDRFGRWYDLRDIADMAQKHGFSVAFHGSIFYMHSFHAVMKLK